MNNREQFEVWAKDNWMYIDVPENAIVIWKAGEESKQSEIDNANKRDAQNYKNSMESAVIASHYKEELDKANAEVEHYLSSYRLAHKQAMDNGQARDKANARIAQLEEFIGSITKCRGGMINGNIAAICAEVALKGSSDTWLSQHDKALEVRVLENVINHCAFFNYRDEVIATIVAMLESRK